MKKIIIVLSALILLFIAPIAIVQGEDKKDSEKTKITTVPAGEVIDNDYFGFGDVVEISGTVNGDVYAFGGQVLVDGKVNGDLITGAGTLSISGDVTQDVRAGGGQITISGNIGRNVTVGGGNIEFTKDAKVAGSVLAGGGNISLAAPVGGNVKIGAGNLTISNKINGDVEAGVGQIRVTSKAQVAGDLTYWSDQTASIDENAKIAGEVTKKKPPAAASPSPEKIFGVFTGFNLFLKIISLLSTLIVGLLLIKLFPRFSQGTISTLQKRPWASLGIGLAALVLTPIIFVILLVTILGIPLALILLALYLIALYLVRIFVMFWAGRFIADKTGVKMGDAWALVLGLVVYSIVTLVPIIGGLVTLFVILFGLGAVFLTKKEAYSAARKKEII